MRRALSWLAALCFLALCSSAHAERRVALVIGVSKYLQVPALANPTRDADTISRLFKNAGFDEVIDERDLGIAGIRRAVRDFAEKARDADIAVVYYAGHGIEIDGSNYLVPVDAKLASDFDVEDETISLDRLMRALEPARRLKLIILDACRDNPFARTMKRSIATRSIGRGLAKIEPAGGDTLVAFAAKAGAVASDGDGTNGPFAVALVKYITEPGLDLRLALGRVRDDVLQTTGNRQEPFVYGSLGGATMSLVPPLPKAADPDAAARVDFELAAQIGTRASWDAFLSKYTSGPYASMARVQSRTLADAEDARLKAESARRDAEKLASEKTEELRRQLDEQVRSRKSSEQADQTKRELEDARQKMEAAQKDAQAARQQIEESKRVAAASAQLRAKQDAEKQADAAKQEAARVASLEPVKQRVEPPVAPEPAMDPSDVARLLQAHLRRVGCEPGTVDGNWTDKSRKALENYNARTKHTFDVRVASLGALDAVRLDQNRVCPLACKRGQQADGDRCIQITCGNGLLLNNSGVCVKRPDPPVRKPAAVAHRDIEPRAPLRVKTPARPERSGGGGGGKCFAFSGRTYCE